MRDPARVFAQLVVRLDQGARRDFAFQPGGEGGLLGYGAGVTEAGDEGRGVVAGGVAEVLEVEGWFDGGVGGG